MDGVAGFSQHQLFVTDIRGAEDRVLDLLPDNDIKASMQALPRQFREAVYYAYVEGLREDEISALMMTPRRTVTSRLHRG